MRILVLGDEKPLVEVEDSIRALARGLRQQDHAVDNCIRGRRLIFAEVAQKAFFRAAEIAIGIKEFAIFNPK